jgi:hypothetical protein
MAAVHNESQVPIHSDKMLLLREGGLTIGRRGFPKSDRLELFMSLGGWFSRFSRIGDSFPFPNLSSQAATQRGLYRDAGDLIRPALRGRARKGYERPLRFQLDYRISGGIKETAPRHRGAGD